MTVRVSRHLCGQTLYLSQRCGIPPPFRNPRYIFEIVYGRDVYPDPPALAFWKKARETPRKKQKTRVFLFAEPLKSLENEGKTPLRTEKHLDSQRRDRILRFFLRPEIGPFPPHFGAISLLTKNMEKRCKHPREKIQKIQWRRRPEIADLCPLSSSNVPWTSKNWRALNGGA